MLKLAAVAGSFCCAALASSAPLRLAFQSLGGKVFTEIAIVHPPQVYYGLC
jgi:hypothetical protein